MTQPDFKNATKAELRAYIVAHPDDREAFRVFADRFTADTSPETFDMPQSVSEIEAVESFIQQRVQQLK